MVRAGDRWGGQGVPYRRRMDRPHVRCVCFDWGGVILAHCRTWPEACARAGLPVHTAAIDPTLQDQRRALNHKYTLGLIGCDEFFAGLAGLCGGAYTPEQVRTIHHAWLTQEYEGVGALIDKLHWAGRVETGLLSNTCAAHWARHLPRAGRPADFPTIGRLRHKHASHLLGCAKPEVEAFRAFESLSKFRPQHILFFDDLPENVQAARNAGWHAERIDHTRETAPQIEAVLRVYGLL